MKKITKLVIPVAGLGTRLLPASKTIPKEMFPVLDKPMLHLIIEDAVKSGIEEVILVTSGYKKSIEDYFDKHYELEDILLKKNKTHELEIVKATSNMVKIYYVRQKEPLGTADAIKLANIFIKENEYFAVMWGEDIMYSDNVPVLKQAMDIHYKYDCNVISAISVDPKDTGRYGILELNNDTNEVLSVVEKPSPKDALSNIAATGPYIVSSRVFDEINKLKIGVGNEYQFTDALSNLIGKEKMYANVFDGIFYPTGDKFGFFKVNLDFALRDPEIKDKVKEYIKSLDI